MRKIEQFGVELEGGVYYKGTHHRVDLCEALGLGGHNGFHLAIGKAGCVGTDNGRHEIEVAVSPCESIAELKDKLGECLQEVVRPDWEIHWTGQDPFVANGTLPPAAWAPKPRYGAIRQVVAAERPDLYPFRGPEMNWMSQFWAYHLQLQIDSSSPEGVDLRNWLVNWGPHRARSVEEWLGRPTERVQRSWVGWGDERRLPAYRWFESPGEMLHSWQEVPRVARQAKNGFWVPDRRRKLLQPGDPTDEGFVWWSVRPRWSLSTIEDRWHSSLPPANAPTLTSHLLEFAEEVLRGWQPYRFSREEWEGIRNSRTYWRQWVSDHPEVRMNLP